LIAGLVKKEDNFVGLGGRGFTGFGVKEYVKITFWLCDGLFYNGGYRRVVRQLGNFGYLRNVRRKKG
jgi:hypothetical protein